MASVVRSTLSRRRFFALSSGAASVALLASCSGGSGSGSGSGGSPQPGGAFTFSTRTGVDQTLDLHDTQDPTTYRFVGPICSKLLDFRTGPDLLTSQEVTPDLAQEWQLSEDGLTYTFRLRDDVTWHDIPPVNGRPFTSDDVVATFEDTMTRPARHSWMFDRVADIQAPDDHTVVIRMNQIYAPFLEYMAHPWNVILPREHIERRFDIDNLTIGTGPFMFDTHQNGEQFIVVRNPNYFVPNRPYLDELHFVVIPEANAAISAFQSGRVNNSSVPSEQYDMFEAMPDVRLRSTGYTPVALHLQMERPPFDDLRVRRAVAMAINFEGLGETIYPNQWALSTAIPPNCGEYALGDDEIRQIRPYDPQRARDLLAEAGHPNGFDTTMLVQELSPQDVDGAEYMLQDLREVGINIDLQVQDASTAVQRRLNGEFDMAKSVRITNLADAYLNDYETGARLNFARIADPALDSMIAESREMLDHDQRVEQFHEIARYMETEICSAIYGICYSPTEAISTQVQDYYPSQYNTGRWWADVWMAD